MIRARLYGLTSFFALTASLLPGQGMAADAPAKTDPKLVALERRMECSAKDGKPAFYSFQGRLYSRRQGEPDQLLFKVDGMNVRACVKVEDPVKGLGFKLVSREILLYLDKETGEPLTEWKNPWTGKTVKVLQTRNDPVNRTIFPVKDTTEVYGGLWRKARTVPLFYPNPLGGDYQRYVGKPYQAVEMFTNFGLAKDLNSSADSIAVAVAWTRTSDWLPWMEMAGREGQTYVHADGAKVSGFDDLTPVMKAYITANAPDYKSPPPLDDARPSESSWTGFGKAVPGEPPAKAAQPGGGPPKP